MVGDDEVGESQEEMIRVIIWLSKLGRERILTVRADRTVGSIVAEVRQPPGQSQLWDERTHQGLLVHLGVVLDDRLAISQCGGGGGGGRATSPGRRQTGELRLGLVVVGRRAQTPTINFSTTVRSSELLQDARRSSASSQFFQLLQDLRREQADEADGVEQGGGGGGGGDGDGGDDHGGDFNWGELAGLGRRSDAAGSPLAQLVGELAQWDLSGVGGDGQPQQPTGRRTMSMAGFAEHMVEEFGEPIANLMSFGFSQSQILVALVSNQLDAQVAFEWLLTNASDPNVEHMLSPELIAPVAKRLGIDLEEPLPPAIQAALRENVCTYRKTGKDFAFQRWYQCETCGLTGSSGVCVVCAQRCHAGHTLLPQIRATGFYCDCGSAAYCKSLSSHSSASSSSSSSLD